MYLCPQPEKVISHDGILYFDNPGELKIHRRDDASLCGEAYRLTVDENGICAAASGEKGFHNAEVTLRQLLMNCRGALPFIEIEDSPEYEYRGFMIDPCRHFFTVSEIKKMIDAAELFKFNKFHFHISDDQGFRYESEVFPELTAKGSVRPGSHFDKDENDNSPYGGYFTKDELRDIVAYCKGKQIDVIPEIDMPGHTTSILSAFPELSCRGLPIESKTVGGIFDDILCAGNENTLPFLKALVDELCEIFTGEYFHIGGDEAPKTRWEKCEKCTAKLKELGLSSYEELQGWLVNEMAEYLHRKGKKVICWNEALKGKNISADNVTVALWMDKEKLSVKYANSGKPIIDESFTPYYVDYPYGMHPLKAVYTHNPKKLGGLSETGKSSIKGVESPIWTEHVRSFERMTYLCFPRWLAVAETGWNGNAGKNYDRFKKTASFFCDILREQGISPAPESDWDISPAKRLSETVGFFAKNLNKETITAFFKKEN